MSSRWLEISACVVLMWGIFRPPLPVEAATAEEPPTSVLCPVIEDCVVDYLNFPKVAPDPPSPLPDVTLARLLKQMDHEQLPLTLGPIAVPQMRTLLLDGLNVRKLLSEASPGAFRFEIGSRQQHESFHETEVTIIDPYVGTIRGVFFSPLGSGPHPAILVVHGHTDTPGDLFERIGLRSLPEAGFALLMLEQRGAGADYWEDRTVRRLLRAGHSFLGLRVYESILGLRLLQSLPAVVPDQLGLLGHSGGSVVSNITAWLDEGFSAYVSDHSSDYLNIVDGWMGDETSPAMYRLHRQINRQDAAAVPTLKMPYDYPMGLDNVVQFFGRHLTASTTAEGPPGRP